MPSKLTQAERQRRAGVRAALKVVGSLRDQYPLNTPDRIALNRAESLLFDLLAPHSLHNSEKIKCSKRPKRHTQKRIKPALSASAYKKRGKGAK